MVEPHSASEPSRSFSSQLDAGLQRGAFAGAVVRLEVRGLLVAQVARGARQRYALRPGDGHVHPLHEPHRMQPDALFDVASLTKVVTTLGALAAVRDGQLQLDRPVADVLPALAAPGKASITLRQLLQHRSGLPAWLPFYLRVAGRDQLVADIAGVVSLAEPGQQRLYSDLNFILLGMALEKACGQRLDAYLRRRLFEPLGCRRTGFAPRPEGEPLVATSHGNPFERRMLDDPSVGLGYRGPEQSADFTGWRNYTLVGEVNDANAYHACDQVAGHAGLFCDAAELTTLLRPYAAPTSPAAQRLGLDAELLGQPLGWEAAAPFAERHGPLGHDPAAHGSRVHTGFTGTFAFVDPSRDLSLVVLTNRQHLGHATGHYADLRPLYADLTRAAYRHGAA